MMTGFRGTVQQAATEDQARRAYCHGMQNASPDAERYRRQLAAGRKVFGQNVAIFDVDQKTPDGPYEVYR